jgi:hypothetical protein
VFTVKNPFLTTGLETQLDYPAPLRRIGYRDPETGKVLVFLTNNFTVPALTVTQLYRGRWQIELFFKWLKQHLRIKAFYGTSPNAVAPSPQAKGKIERRFGTLQKRLVAILAYEKVRSYAAAQLVLDRECHRQNATACRTTSLSPNAAWAKSSENTRSNSVPF